MEIAANTDIGEFVRKDVAKTEVDIKDDAMWNSLTNNTLLSKRIVSAMKSEDSQSQELELKGGVAGVKSNTCVGKKI